MTRAAAKVSLVVWSLGGLYARQLAKMMPERVRGVITLGSPFAATSRRPTASTRPLYRPRPSRPRPACGTSASWKRSASLLVTCA